MRRYIAFYQGRKVEIDAASMYAASVIAVDHFKVPKSKRGLLTVVLADVLFSPASLPGA